MLFTSLTFVIFLFILFFLYWFILKNRTGFQNVLLLAASYVFYGWWDVRFLLILVFISGVNYLIGLRLETIEKKNIRKILYYTGLIINTGTLLTFKYFNFFSDGFIKISRFAGFSIDPFTLKLLLPVGISFYIFLSLSYLIDVYRKNLSAEKNIISLFLSFSFFPIILAGPIQRPMGLLPQIKNTRNFDNPQVTDGLKQIMWGIFMKNVIADNCAVYADHIFSNHSVYKSSTLLVGAVLFTIQIYSDFAGYSNIAIGLGKLFGFNIIRNFAYPYFSKDITEFWKRWNISLTTWFRDYIFLPIAFSLTRKIKNEKVLFVSKEMAVYIAGIGVTWSLTGLWHGANYTFIVWGIIQGSLLVFYHGSRKIRRRVFKKLKIKNDNLLVRSAEYLFTLMIIMFSWVFFRSDNLMSAYSYIFRIFSTSVISIPEYRPIFLMILLILLFFAAEWFGKNSEYAIQKFFVNQSRTLRWALYYGIIILTFFYSIISEKFIYFQF